MFPYTEGLLGSNAYSLLNVIDFLCLVAGVYLFAVLHDRRRHAGYLLLAIGMGVLAVRVLHDQLLMYGGLHTPDSVLASWSDSIAVATAAFLVSWGTIALMRRAPRQTQPNPFRTLFMAIAAALAILASVVVWALPFWQPLREMLSIAQTTGSSQTVQLVLGATVAAAWLVCAWAYWVHKPVGDGISRMFGAALFGWALAVLVQIINLGVPVDLFWVAHFLRVLGSLFLGNALAMLVYEAERVAHERQRRLAVVDAVARKGITAPGLDEMVRAATEELARVMAAGGAAIYLIDTTTGLLDLLHSTGGCAIDLPPRIHRTDDHPIARAAEDNECARFDVPLPAGEPYHGALCEAVATPLMGVADLVGVVVVGATPGDRLEPADIETVRNAGAQLGIIIQNMALLEGVRDARDRWQQTFDSITELVTVHNAAGEITAANNAMLELTGLNADEVPGVLPERLFPQRGEEVTEAVKHCLVTGESLPAEDHLSADQQIHQVQITPIKDARGVVTGCVRVARDVTTARRAADRIAQSEGRYRELAEGANDVIYTHDLLGNFLYVNRRAVDVFGHSRREFAQLRFLDLVVPEEAARAKDYITDLVAGAEGEQSEFPMLARDGSVVVLQLGATLMRRDGQPVGVHGIARDVTAEKQLTEQLLQYERLASVGTLIAGIAHELNNPLTVITGYVELLRSGLSESRVDEALATIAEQAERCRAMAQDLLGFARRPEDHLTRMDVNRAVRGVLDLQAYDLRSTNVRVETDLDPHLPEVLTEHGQLQQVIYNLVSNAHDAMAEEGGILTITTGVSDGNVVFTIADTGSGIPPALLPKIFEPFFTTKARGEGTGLGLSICQNIVQIYGGTISAANRPDGGAAFTVALPPAAHADTPAEPEPTETDAVALSDQITPARVLIIEDEIALAELVAIYLQRSGHEVVAEHNGNDGLARALAEDFDLIICDVQLPGINGDEVAVRLLQERPELDNHIVIATGDVLSPATRALFDETGLPHIHKPFKLEQLSELLNACMAGQPMRSH